MGKIRKEIKKQFFEQLKKYISGRNESSLVEAYELSRKAIEDGMGGLDFLRLYHEALFDLNLLEKNDSNEERLKLASGFLSECLAPLEMRQRGFKDLIEKLNKQNKQLQAEIDRRRTSENELKRSKEHFQLLIENALDIITVLDFDGTIRYQSPALERILGYEPKELMGKVLFDYVHDADEQKVKNELAALTKLKRRKNKNITEFRVKHKDGSWRYLESIAKKVNDIRDGPGVIVNSRDITERFEAHQQVKKSQNQLAAAQKIAFLGSWEWDTNKDRLEWSDELCQIYGILPENTPADYSEWMRFIPEDDSRRIESIIKKAFKNREKFEFEHRINRPDGSERIVYCMGEVIEEGAGDGIKMFGTGQDITNIKQAEKKLREYSEQLRNLSAKQDKIREDERIRIAREIHDELGQMLTVLKMDVSLLMKKATTKSNEQWIAKVRQETDVVIERIDTIIQSVQRITTELRPEVLDDLGLSEAIEWQASEFEKRTGIKLYIYNKENSFNQLNEEQSTAIFRIFQETLTNILRHAGATVVKIKMNQDEEFFTLKVHDNGKGISQKEVEHKNSLGIIGMRERSQFLGGSISFNDINGTEVTLKIPLINK